METDDKIIKEGNYVEKNKKGLNIILVIVITMIISVLVSVGGTIAVIKLYPEVFGTTVTNVSKLEKEVTVTDTGLGDAVEKVYDSVIVVENHKSGKLRATGTGFVYKKDGNKYYFLTNQHVVQNSDEIKVVFNREFTKGYLFKEKNSLIVNKKSVNHQGIEIGKIENKIFLLLSLFPVILQNPKYHKY